MPTVVLLDVSLSMLRRVQTADVQENLQRRHLAIRGLYTLFDQLCTNFKLEFTALIAYSSLWEIAVPFTRDYESLKQGCMSVDVYDKTCFENAFSGVVGHVIEEWGSAVPCQVIVVTDGSTGSGYGSLRNLLGGGGHRAAEQPCPLPFPFPSKLHVVCIATQPEVAGNLADFQALCDLNGEGGSVYCSDGPLSVQSVQNMFTRLVQTHYISYEGDLLCGHLQSRVCLSPPPDFSYSWNSISDGHISKSKLKEKLRHFPSELTVCGFLDMSDVGSPPCLSQHLVTPRNSVLEDKGMDGSLENGKDSEEDGKDSEEDGKVPSFCVLLHGSLKVEKMVAIVQINSEWFGMLHSWADSKKKSNLVLSTFHPGREMSWLGSFKKLGPAAEMNSNPYQLNTNKDCEDTPFPVMPSQKRSYNSQANVVWIKASGLQSDVQKLLRYAKRLPDKQPQFYKELNRLRRASLCYSFLELLETLATMLEKECSKVNSAEAEIQLRHATMCLREASKYDLNKTITPLLE